jgi:nitrate/TMAO reductase-like tetraheme cytochrome c subunit
MQTIQRLLYPIWQFAYRHRGATLLTLGFVLIFSLLAIPPTWEYTNSPGFCGTTCHTMPPEYATYQVSPHARVLCVDCHIGRDLIAVQFSRKIGHTRLVAATILDNYEYPIRVRTMRPARQTCEECHFPEKFSDDSLRVVHRSEGNRTNDPYDVYLLMHTGGGSEREGLGRGIHWHVENKVSYIPLDPEEQDIPWVKVEYANGEVAEYNSIDSPIDTDNLEKYEIREMDCTTCHNRISHLIVVPDRAVDDALYQGDISRDIPFIRTRSIELLSTAYNSFDEAHAAIETLDPYYRDNYADFYAEGQAQVQEAIEVLKRLYDENNYPEQLLNWETHPNNIGHMDAPGCFRCHDGKHLTNDGESIRLECNLCHSIPQVVRPGAIEPSLPLATGLEPASHLDSTWITQHHNVYDETCANCHTTENAGGITDTSFCSNSGCHANKWTYAGFDAPGLATILGYYQTRAEPILEDFEGQPTYTILQPLFLQECGACHGATPSKGLRLIDYESLLAGGEDGVVVVAGSPNESLMIQTLEKGHFARLSDHQMELLIQWITDGLPLGEENTQTDTQG